MLPNFEITKVLALRFLSYVLFGGRCQKFLSRKCCCLCERFKVSEMGKCCPILKVEKFGNATSTSLRQRPKMFFFEKNVGPCDRFRVSEQGQTVPDFIARKMVPCDLWFLSLSLFGETCQQVLQETMFASAIDLVHVSQLG